MSMGDAMASGHLADEVEPEQQADGRGSAPLGNLADSLWTDGGAPDEEEALEALGRVGLRERAKHLPSQLSGGEQQRVCVARALINHPELILADEPTGNLDEANENIVLDLFRQLHREGTTLIVVTHDPEVAEAAQRTIVLEHGRVAREIINENFVE
jgi:putative ABC transport system ATP-binding protein